MTKIQSYGIVAGLIGVTLIAFGMYMSEVAYRSADQDGCVYAKLWCVALGVFAIAGGVSAPSTAARGRLFSS